MYVAINGYGVPKDIMRDFNYYSYLTQVVNVLRAVHGRRKMTIVPCGGPTDLFRPYQRTEAGEMARWLRLKLKELDLTTHWRLRLCATEVSALENILALKQIARRGDIIYFCEKTREHKMRVLARRIFDDRARVIGIEFDGSAPRYDDQTRRKLAIEDLEFSLRALRDSQWRERLNQANHARLRALRRLPLERRVNEIDRLTLELRREFMAQ